MHWLILKKTTLKWNKYQYTLSAQESSLGSRTINAWWSQTQRPCAGICSASQMAYLPIRDVSARLPSCSLWRVRAPLDCRDHAAKGSSLQSHFFSACPLQIPLSDWHILSLDMLIWSIRLLRSPCTLGFWGGKHFVSKMPLEYVLSHPLCIDFYSWILLL